MGKTGAEELTIGGIIAHLEHSLFFTFHTNRTVFNGELKQRMMVPTLVIVKRETEQRVLENIRDWFGLKNRIYLHTPYRKDGLQRKPRAILMIRDFVSLKNRLAPFLYKNLRGRKAEEFRRWI